MEAKSGGEIFRLEFRCKDGGGKGDSVRVFGVPFSR